MQSISRQCLNHFIKTFCRSALENQSYHNPYLTKVKVEPSIEIKRADRVKNTQRIIFLSLQGGSVRVIYSSRAYETYPATTATGVDSLHRWREIELLLRVVVHAIGHILLRKVGLRKCC